MNTVSTTNECPKCGKPIPEEAPQGLCPYCLLAGAAHLSESGPGFEGKLTPPSLASVVAAFPELEIIELLGVGGMGIVYRARQRKWIAGSR